MDKYNALGIIVEKNCNEAVMSRNNDNHWVKHTGEIAEIKQLQKHDHDNWYIVVLERIDLGHLIRIFCSNAGRKDYMSASIFVPWGIVISGKKLSEIVDVTKTELLNWNKDTSKAKLENLFSETYDVKDTQQNQMETSSDKIAYRFYGEKYCQLYDLLDNLDQPYYSSYKLIFFIDKNSNIQCDTADDLTDKQLIKSVTIAPPKDSNGFAPYIEDKPFSKPIKRYIDDSTLCISWKREGYKTIEKTTKISSSNVVLDSLNQNDYIILVPYGSIVVKDKKGDKIDNYRLRINNKNIAPNDYAEIREDSITKVHVQVTADDYEDYNKTTDLKSKNVKIVLQKKKKKYKFIIKTKHSDSISYEKITEDHLKESPIKGYVTEDGKIDTDRDNNLVYRPFTKVHLVLCLIIFCGGYALSFFITPKTYNKEINKLQQENQQLKKLHQQLKEKNREMENLIRKQKEEDSASLNEAINYLDNNEKWNRTEMEKYEETKGLWDDLNARRFDDILNYREKLSGSIKFNEVAECVEKYIENNKDKKVQKYHNDSVITIDDYISKLNDASVKNKSTKNNVSKKESQGNW